MKERVGDEKRIIISVAVRGINLIHTLIHICYQPKSSLVRSKVIIRRKVTGTHNRPIAPP